MKTEATPQDFQKSISAVTKQGLTVLLMLVVSGLLGYLPGADILLFGRMSLAVVLRFGIAAAVGVLVLLVRRHAVHVLLHCLRGAFLRRTGDGPLEASATKLARGITGLVYVWLLYWIFMWGVGPVVSVLTAASWPFTLVRLCSLAVAVAAIIGIFVGASPLFGQAGDALAGTVSRGPEPTRQVKCSGCGVLDDGGSKYCRFCGRALVPETDPDPAMPGPKTCARCGAAVEPPARFCPACGKPA
jgi:hypothetical protein